MGKNWTLHAVFHGAPAEPACSVVGINNNSYLIGFDKMDNFTCMSRYFTVELVKHFVIMLTS